MEELLELRNRRRLRDAAPVATAREDKKARRRRLRRELKRNVRQPLSREACARRACHMSCMVRMGRSRTMLAKEVNKRARVMAEVWNDSIAATHAETLLAHIVFVRVGRSLKGVRSSVCMCSQCPEAVSVLSRGMSAVSGLPLRPRR